MVSGWILQYIIHVITIPHSPEVSSHGIHHTVWQANLSTRSTFISYDLQSNSYHKKWSKPSTSQHKDRLRQIYLLYRTASEDYQSKLKIYVLSHSKIFKSILTQTSTFTAWGEKKKERKRRKKKKEKKETKKKKACELPGTNKETDKIQGLTFHVLY